MAFYFAKRCNADFQFHALAEMLEKPEIGPGMPTILLADHLFHWMLGDTPFMEQILENVTTSPHISTADSMTVSKTLPPQLAQAEQTQFFYGNEGKREATRQIVQLASALELSSASSIYFISDINLEWLFEDYQFMKEFSAAFTSVFHKGYTVYHIMPSLNFMNRYVESLRYWLPLYASGHARVYYYPRLRDNLYRRNLIIVPGICVQATTSIGDNTDLITMNSTDPALVRAYEKQFQQELNLCRPALNSHHALPEFSVCMQELLKSDSPAIHKAFQPTPYTLPVKYLNAYISQVEDPEWKQIIQMHRDNIPLFERKLERHSFIELCPLATPEEIRAGNVLFGARCKIIEHPPVYTPEIYSAHLERILDLMDKYENYHFIPIDPKERQDYSLFTSESGLALLLSRTHPPFMLEIRRPELSQSCHEYLMRMADLVGGTGMKRTKIRMKLRELIQELRS